MIPRASAEVRRRVYAERAVRVLRSFLLVSRVIFDRVGFCCSTRYSNYLSNMRNAYANGYSTIEIDDVVRVSAKKQEILKCDTFTKGVLKCKP